MPEGQKIGSGYIEVKATGIPQIKEEVEDLQFATMQMDAGLRQVGQTMGKDGQFGRGIMQASFIVQDFTSAGANLERGLFSIQNNIPMLLTGLGMGSGLAGVISIVTVGVGLLVTNWTSLKNLWDGGETEKEAARVKKLADNTKLAADELTRLKKLQGTYIDERKGAVELAIKDVGYGQALKDVQAALIAKQGSFGRDADKAMAEQLLSNATRGRTDSLDFLDIIFQSGVSGSKSKFGKAMEDPGGKKEDARLKAFGDLEAERRRAVSEREQEDENRRTRQEVAQRQHEFDLAQTRGMGGVMIGGGGGGGGGFTGGGFVGGGGGGGGGGFPGFGVIDVIPEMAPAAPRGAAQMGMGNTALQQRIARAQARRRAKKETAKRAREIKKLRREMAAKARAQRVRETYGMVGKPVFRTDEFREASGPGAAGESEALEAFANAGPVVTSAQGPRRPGQGAAQTPPWMRGLMGTSGQGVSNTDKLIGMTGQMGTELDQLRQKVQQQGRTIDQLRNQQRSRARNAQKTGG